MTFINGMYGLGDSIFQRPFLKYYPGAYVRTPWPELYKDLDVKPVRSATRLRTQEKNEQSSLMTYYDAPDCDPMTISYTPHSLIKHGSIINTFRTMFNVRGALTFDLPDFGPSPVRSRKPVAVIRPVTLRKEWDSTSRGCDPQYICDAALYLRNAGYHVVSIADLEDDREWLVGDVPYADEYYHRGELNVTQLMALIKHAAVVVTPVGWTVPASIAYGTPCFIVAGGRGGHNAPHIITDPQMNLSRVGWAIPDRYCMCSEPKHECDKVITDFTGKLERWLNVNVVA